MTIGGIKTGPGLAGWLFAVVNMEQLARISSTIKNAQLMRALVAVTCPPTSLELEELGVQFVY